MKVAIVHDYLVNKGGAERVTLALHEIYPDAPIYTSLYHPESTYEAFRDADVRTSSLQRFSKDATQFRRLLPLFPHAFKQMDLSGFDVVISSSAGFAHRVRVPEGTCHVVYSYSPPRFLWDDRYDRKVAPAWARPLVAPTMAWLRRSDKRAARKPHFYMAVSGVAAARLRSVYGLAATVVHPPVATHRFHIGPTTSDFYLIVARLLPHRSVDLAVQAFTKMGRRLVVVGEGPMRAELEAMAGPTIEFRGVVDEETLTNLYGRCRGVVVPGEEDFGLTPLEANASGRPAIALRAGGALETMVDGVTGVLFAPGTPGALIGAVEQADRTSFNPDALRVHAEGWSEGVFANRVRSFVARSVESCITCARAKRDRKVMEKAPSVREVEA
ncbi:MAG: glycosyltransferase [Actinobacteria bacterium]|nr:glycosyltransferase [Actinomycetota bacterium]